MKRLNRALAGICVLGLVVVGCGGAQPQPEGQSSSVGQGGDDAGGASSTGGNAAGGSAAGGNAAGGSAAGGSAAGGSAAGGAGGEAPTEVVVEEHQDGSFLCLPAAAGAQPGVLFNHGGSGDNIGGDLEGTCQALAEAGYVGYSKMRRKTVSLEGHIDDVLEGLDYLLARSEVDADRIGIMGFSRGAMLTLQAAELRNEPDAVVLLGLGPDKGPIDQILADANKVGAPLQLLVAENDQQANAALLESKVVPALQAAGLSVSFKKYPPWPYDEDGHKMFFTVGDWFDDVKAFVKPLLK